MWRRAAIGAGLLAAGAPVGAGVYAASTLNYIQRRDYEGFLMVPEELQMPFERLDFVTDDGVRLEGWFIPQTVDGKPNKRCILMCNPYNSSKSSMLGIARGLWEQGNNVMLFDFRSHAVGEKGKKTKHTIGHLEMKDARAALQCLRRRAGSDAHVGILGASMGGAVALRTAAREEGIAAVATDCAFADLASVVDNYVRNEALPAMLPTVIVDMVFSVLGVTNRALYGWDVAAVRPVDEVAELRMPLFFLHSEGDKLVPVSHAERLFEVAPPKSAAGGGIAKRLEIVPRVDHLGAYFVDRRRYVRLFAEFFDAAFVIAEEEEAQKAAGGSAASAAGRRRGRGGGETRTRSL